MDAALNAKGEVVTIDQVRGLAVLPDLWCPGELRDGSECGAKAWATSLQSTKRAAAFAAHHRDGCDEGRGGVQRTAPAMQARLPAGHSTDPLANAHRGR